MRESGKSISDSIAKLRLPTEAVNALMVANHMYETPRLSAGNTSLLDGAKAYAWVEDLDNEAQYTFVAVEDDDEVTVIDQTEVDRLMSFTSSIPCRRDPCDCGSPMVDRHSFHYECPDCGSVTELNGRPHFADLLERGVESIETVIKQATLESKVHRLDAPENEEAVAVTSCVADGHECTYIVYLNQDAVVQRRPYETLLQEESTSTLLEPLVGAYNIDAGPCDCGSWSLHRDGSQYVCADCGDMQGYESYPTATPLES
jgi:hypothetical protein